MRTKALQFSATTTALAVLSLTGCATPKPEAENVPACCRAKKAAVTRTQRIATRESLYHSTAEWQTDSGGSFKFSDLAGRPCVVSLFFASCSMKCPIIAENMLSVEASLPRESRANVRFLLVTFDPESDTVEALRSYRVAHGLTESNWTLLRGTRGDVAALASQLGFVYERNGLGSFRHDSLITVLDGTGRIVCQGDSLYSGGLQVASSVRSLVAPVP